MWFHRTKIIRIIGSAPLVCPAESRRWEKKVLQSRKALLPESRASGALLLMTAMNGIRGPG
jgi:hypothetical protein